MKRTLKWDADGKCFLDLGKGDIPIVAYRVAVLSEDGEELSMESKPTIPEARKVLRKQRKEQWDAKRKAELEP